MAIRYEKHDMLKVGITGGIGSGKSVVSGIFDLLRIPVYNSDARARQIMEHSEHVRTQIIDSFGTQAYDENGSLNRDFIASQVFSNKKMLSQLNAIVHPAVGDDFEQWCSTQEGKPYILKEAALIFEAGINKFLDKVILIFAPEELRISRVMSRDEANEESVQSRIENQWSDRKKAPLADYIIVNDGDHSLLRQTLEIHKLLVEYAQKSAK